MTPEELAHYSAALDEIYSLRAALAYEAQVVEAHLSYKTFPKSRRLIAEDQIERMRASARGVAHREYSGRPSQSLKYALREAGASECLTRAQWEER